MALTATPVGFAPVNPVAKAVPLSTEVVSILGYRYALLDLDIGATATTVTITRPGQLAAGDNRATWSSGPLTSTRLLFLLTPEYVDGNGNVTIVFSQVTGVTGRIVLLP